MDCATDTIFYYYTIIFISVTESIMGRDLELWFLEVGVAKSNTMTSIKTRKLEYISCIEETLLSRKYKCSINLGSFD